MNGLTLIAMLKIGHAVYRLHNATAYQMSMCYRYRGENEGFAALFPTIMSLKTKKRKHYAVIVHWHFSEFNDNAETLSYVTVVTGNKAKTL